MVTNQPEVGTYHHFCIACDEPAVRWLRDLQVAIPDDPQCDISYTPVNEFIGLCTSHQGTRHVRVFDAAGQRDYYWEMQFRQDLEEPDEEVNHPAQ